MGSCESSTWRHVCVVLHSARCGIWPWSSMPRGLEACWFACPFGWMLSSVIIVITTSGVQYCTQTAGATGNNRGVVRLLCTASGYGYSVLQSLRGSSTAGPAGLQQGMHLHHRLPGIRYMDNNVWASYTEATQCMQYWGCSTSGVCEL